MPKTSELAHLFRALKAPAAARSFPALADRAREEQWSYERFAEALLSTEVSAREAHGGEGRIKSARFPALTVATDEAREPPAAATRRSPPIRQGACSLEEAISAAADASLRLLTASGGAFVP